MDAERVAEMRRERPREFDAAGHGEPFTCCEKKNIVVMDFEVNGSPRLNRACIRCFAHWYGRPGRVRKYRRPEWDAMLSHELKTHRDIVGLAVEFVNAFEKSQSGSGMEYDRLLHELWERGLLSLNGGSVVASAHRAAETGDGSVKG